MLESFCTKALTRKRKRRKLKLFCVSLNAKKRKPIESGLCYTQIQKGKAITKRFGLHAKAKNKQTKNTRIFKRLNLAGEKIFHIS